MVEPNTLGRPKGLGVNTCPAHQERGERERERGREGERERERQGEKEMDQEGRGQQGLGAVQRGRKQ